MRLNNPWRSRWVRVLGTTLGALFLLPIPGLALTFLGPWQVLTNIAFGPGVPRAIITPLPDTGPPGNQVGTVLVDMGNVNTSRPGIGTSTVTIQRQFSVDNSSGERLLYTPNFSTQLYDADAVITATLGRVQGRGGFFIPVYTYPPLVGINFGNSPSTFQYTGSGFTSPLIRRGSPYALRITITYLKFGRGFWRYQHMSPHRFRFSRA